MEIRIELEVDNDAFAGSAEKCAEEAERIASDALRAWAGDPQNGVIKMRDINGNTVGKLTVSGMPLPSECNTPETEAAVLAAFEASGLGVDPNPEAFFEHGHWWVREERDDQDRPCVTWSVGDEEVNGVDGFCFEET